MSPYLVISFAFLVTALNGVMLDAAECNGKAEITFILDSSGSIRAEDYAKIMDFAENFDIEPNEVLLGGVRRDGRGIFNLNANDNTEGIKKGISNVENLSPSTDPHTATELIEQGQLFSSYKGNGPKVPRYLIIVTDGTGATDAEKLEALRDLKDSGIEVLTIGVGSQIEMVTPEQFAASRGVFFSVNSYADLESIELPLTQLVCEVEESK